jgi:hypothetical protein
MEWRYIEQRTEALVILEADGYGEVFWSAKGGRARKAEPCALCGIGLRPGEPAWRSMGIPRSVLYAHLRCIRWPATIEEENAAVDELLRAHFDSLEEPPESTAEETGAKAKGKRKRLLEGGQADLFG